MVAEQRDPPVQPGSRLERLENELAQVKRERDQLLADERMAEWRNQRWSVSIMVAECRKLQGQQTQLRDTLQQIVDCWDGPLYKHEMLPLIANAREVLMEIDTHAN